MRGEEEFSPFPFGENDDGNNVADTKKNSSKKNSKDDSKNFGRQGNLFEPFAWQKGKRIEPIFPIVTYAKAFLYNAMYGREVNRHSFRPLGRKLSNTDISTLIRGIRRDCHIPIARQMRRVKVATPSGYGSYRAKLAHFLLTDQQRYQLEMAFPNWIELVGNDKFKSLIGKPTSKFAKNLLDPHMAENGKIKRPYPRFFKHDPDFLLPDDWIPPEDR